MPPLPAVPNVVHCSFGLTDGSDTTVQATQFFRYSGGPPNATDLNALAADVYNAGRAWVPLLDNFSALDGVRLTDLSSSTAAQGEFALATPGTRGVDILTGATSALVSYVINRRYRGGKPRNYFPFGIQEDLATRQQWSTGFLTDVDAAMTTYFGDVIGASSGTTTITDHVNVSYYDGFTVVTNPITGRAKNVPKRRTVPVVDTIVSFGMKGTPATQRRRNR